MHDEIEDRIEFIFKDSHMESNWYETHASPTQIRDPPCVGDDPFCSIDEIDDLYVLD
jgi:hypothetical protein